METKAVSTTGTRRLNLDPAMVSEARALAARAGQPIVEMATTHTTVSVERAVLRLAGLRGADEDGMPWVNRLVDAIRQSTGLEHGVALPAWDALLSGGFPDLPPRREASRSVSRPVMTRALPALRRGPRWPRASARSMPTASCGPG
jgi:D-Lysine 5,6-aminomutase TIM-barrel domain of alpha subunit